MTTATFPHPHAPNYPMGYSESFLKLLYRRNAASNSAHLLPHLKPGMNLLDLGCGPGQISIDLARAVSPGHLYGIDLAEDQIALARHNAAQQHSVNTTFIPGDAAHLPFEDNFFDAAHCHAFLMHTPKVAAILKEVRRVLKPGAVFAAREMDIPTSYIAPANPQGPTVFDALARIVRQSGGKPLMGRHLKTLFANAGFTRITSGASSDFFDSQDDISFLTDFLMDWALSPEMESKAVRLNICTPGQFDTWRNHVRRWATRPSATGCFHFGHATAFKPHSDT